MRAHVVFGAAVDVVDERLRGHLCHHIAQVHAQIPKAFHKGVVGAEVPHAIRHSLDADRERVDEPIVGAIPWVRHLQAERA